jgi:hypothetical protein
MIPLPSAYMDRLGVLVRTQGYERAAAVLERKPEQLGGVRAVGLGRLKTATRQEALRSARYAAHDLRDLGDLRSRLVAGQPELAAAAAQALGDRLVRHLVPRAALAAHPPRRLARPLPGRGPRPGARAVDL